MKRLLLFGAAVALSLGLVGCGSDAPLAEPKFQEAPKVTLGQANEKAAVQGDASLNKKPK